MRKYLILLFFFLSFNIYAQTLYIMGGKNHAVFLGIFNASPYDSKSIWNEYGTYGNKYNSDCIWNEYGTYGNKYNSYSPWNEYSSDVPILVDKDGNSYGKFNNSNHNEIVRKVCFLAESIQDGNKSLSEWYDYLFN